MTAALSTRVKIAGVILLLPVAASVIQLARFQIWPSAEREVLYASPFPITRHIETPRGRIFDRKGQLLAGNLSHFRVYLDNCQNYLWAQESLASDQEQAPVTMTRVLAEFMQATGVTVNIPSVTQSLQELDQGLREQTQDRQRLRTCTLAVDSLEVNGQRQAVPLWLDEAQETRLRVAQGELPDASGNYHYNPVLGDLRTEAWFVRDYPEGSLASEVVGYSRQSGDRVGNRSENGVVRFYLETGDWGVESYYNEILQGAREDILWTVVPVEITRNMDRAQPPADLLLTIDREIQAEAETILREGIEASDASRGSIIVMSPQTGEILAMADYPPADLAQPESFEEVFHIKGRLPNDPQGQVTSLTVGAPYEPGSIFKVLTMAAGLDSGTVTPDSIFVDDGYFEYGGVVVHNWRAQPFGVQDMTGCMQNSINTCLAWVASKLGPQLFYDYMDRFWIGRTSGVDLPERSGDLRKPGDLDWTDSTLATNAFGQGVSVTPLQIATAISAVANKGVMMTPHVVRSVVRPNGVVQPVRPVALSQPISARTASTLNEMLARSLEIEQSAALVPGYRVAGKTGTADIPPYVNTKTVASFVGWGPVDDPQVLILIRIDEPTSEGDRQFGSVTAAPLFAKLAPRVFAILGIPPDQVRQQLAAQ
jgi:cell division protein FtsI/penicillin-binding protein 2